MRDWWRLACISGTALAIAAIVTRWERVSLAFSGSPLWRDAASPPVAFDGWVGTALGAVASIVIAVWVLRRTLRHDRDQLEMQIREGQRQLADQFTRERELAFEQRRVEAWADLVQAMREFIGFPVDFQEFRSRERQATAAYLRWRLYLEPGDEVVSDGVKAVINSAIGSAREKARVVRFENEHNHPDDPSDIGRSATTDDLVVELAVRGEQWHRRGAGRASAEEWFAERAANV